MSSGGTAANFGFQEEEVNDDEMEEEFSFGPREEEEEEEVIAVPLLLTAATFCFWEDLRCRTMTRQRRRIRGVVNAMAIFFY